MSTVDLAYDMLLLPALIHHIRISVIVIWTSLQRSIIHLVLHIYIENEEKTISDGSTWLYFS
jgi:hypothetical protein